MKQSCQFEFSCVLQSEMMELLTLMMVELLCWCRDAWKKTCASELEGEEENVLFNNCFYSPNGLSRLHLIPHLIVLQWLVN